MPFPGPTKELTLDAAADKEFESFSALLEGWLRKEHTADGGHKAITAESVTATGAADFGGAGTFDGTVTADADGSPVAIGTVTVGGVTESPGIYLDESWAIVSEPGLLGGSSGLVVVDADNPSAASGGAVALYRISAVGATPEYGIGPAPTSVGLRVYVGENSSSKRVYEVNAASVIRERARSTPMGEWTAVAHAGGNFTGNGSMTWTVASGDQTTLSYMLVGKTMTVAWYLASTTVGGTPNTTLQIAIPNSMTAAATALNACIVNDNGAGNAAGIAQVSAGGTVIQILKLNLGNWSAATDATNVFGQLVFEVQ